MQHAFHPSWLSASSDGLIAISPRFIASYQCLPSLTRAGGVPRARREGRRCVAVRRRRQGQSTRPARPTARAILPPAARPRPCVGAGAEVGQAARAGIGSVCRAGRGTCDAPVGCVRRGVACRPPTRGATRTAAFSRPPPAPESRATRPGVHSFRWDEAYSGPFLTLSMRRRRTSVPCAAATSSPGAPARPSPSPLKPVRERGTVCRP